MRADYLHQATADRRPVHPADAGRRDSDEGRPMAPRVLIVEDEQDIAGLIKHTLERSGEVTAEIVSSGDAALRSVGAQLPDLVLLDLNLPVLSGIDVCRILRARPDAKQLPIIMLTARSGENDRVSGLEIGADDYVTKPFSLRELTARVRALLRRTTRPDEPNAVVYQGEHLLADFDAVAVAVDGEPIRLTRREFELLRYLVQNKNRVVSRDRLLERVWGYEYLGDSRLVDAHIRRLRVKIEDQPDAPKLIATVRGMGYRLLVNATDRAGN